MGDVASKVLPVTSFIQTSVLVPVTRIRVEVSACLSSLITSPSAKTDSDGSKEWTT